MVDKKLDRRRAMLFGAKATLAGFALGKLPSATPSGCYLWCAFNSYLSNVDRGVLDDLDALERRARAAGFEVLDRMHQVETLPTVLCRRGCADRGEALREERMIFDDHPRSLSKRVGGVVAFWIEVIP